MLVLDLQLPQVYDKNLITVGISVCKKLLRNHCEHELWQGEIKSQCLNQMSLCPITTDREMHSRFKTTALGNKTWKDEGEDMLSELHKRGRSKTTFCLSSAHVRFVMHVCEYVVVHMSVYVYVSNEQQFHLEIS